MAYSTKIVNLRKQASYQKNIINQKGEKKAIAELKREKSLRIQK